MCGGPKATLYLLVTVSAFRLKPIVATNRVVVCVCYFPATMPAALGP